MKTIFRLTRKPPSAMAQYKTIRNEVREEVKKLGDIHVRLRKEIVEDWGKGVQPTFKSKVTVGKMIELQISVGGSAKAVKVWTILDVTGAQPHWIYPTKPHGLLVFPWGGPGSYLPRTGPSPARYGGIPAVINGELRFVHGPVWHPEIEPRGFSAAINKDMTKELKKVVDRGYKRGLRRAKARSASTH